MRGSGILLHLSSLPSPYGIGTMGKAAYQFVDFLCQCGQRYWQILPVGPISYGDSPYQSFSTFAGNPYFIDFDFLAEDGLLKPDEYVPLPWGNNPAYVNYEQIYQSRFIPLKKAAARGLARGESEFKCFREENSAWAEDYGLYMAVKNFFGMASWQEWEEGIRLRTPQAMAHCREMLKNEIDFWIYLQFLFWKQWRALKTYANEKGISIIGDIPIYVAEDSADVWANPNLFLLDETRRPVMVAGCPPDGFSADGQLWGNPLYHWDVMEQDGFAWWVSRIRWAVNTYDLVRIDHFRGFDSYYAIPYGAKDARNGSWKKGPGMKLFEQAKLGLGELPIIAEDLGFLTDSVRQLLKDSGYPGMKVLQFAFDADSHNEYLPHQYTPHCVAYTGTHDNDTCLGWMESAPEHAQNFCKEYLNLTAEDSLPWEMIRAVWASVAETAIAPLQEFLELGNSSRMNRPSTVGGNWQWRVLPEQLDDSLAQKIVQITRLYGR